jgi:succinate dehydrogenase/fumarate reductase cytochrome b subunit
MFFIKINYKIMEISNTNISLGYKQSSTNSFPKTNDKTDGSKSIDYLCIILVCSILLHGCTAGFWLAFSETNIFISKEKDNISYY